MSAFNSYRMKVYGSLLFSVTVAKSKIQGKRLYASARIPEKRKIGSPAGEIISKKTASEKAKNKATISIVELWNGKALDASIYENELLFINHSCKPNTYMRTIGNHAGVNGFCDHLVDERCSMERHNVQVPLNRGRRRKVPGWRTEL